jgi:4-hydroxythreonine-4-phosphate dehydrogenase
MSRTGKPIVAITGGDPGGIGAEITLKAVSRPSVRAACLPVVVGSAALLVRDLAIAGVDLEIRTISSPAAAAGRDGTIEVIETGALDLAACPRGKLTAAGGKFSGDAVAHAIGLAMNNEVDAVVVAPNNKRAMSDGGYHFSGFEEISRHYTGAKSSIQIVMGRKYIVARVTNHVALREVADLCTRERVLKTIRMLKTSLAAIGFDDPVIGVSGLNPHLGEHGLMGTEEMEHIGPACDDARAEGIRVVGPLPADTIFADREKAGYDAVLSMYHDHGNACIKLAEFGELVNFIGGLPVPVFTVTHGTAFDIAGRGIADPTNMELSICAAAKARGVS